METNTTTNTTTVFVPYKDGVYKLQGEPFTKKDWFKKITDGPFRKAGIVTLLLILVIGVVHYRSVQKNSKSAISSWPFFGHPQATTSYPSITITKGVWSDEINTTGRRFRVIDITPPARRLVMVNNNSGRVYPLPAGPANEVFVGDGVKSLKWMIMADEAVQSSTIKYDLR